MSIQWTIIAAFLYAEIAVVLLLVLPIASPTRWNAIFKSKLLKALQRQAGLLFLILLGVLVIFLLDAIREINKYSGQQEGKHDGHQHLDLEMQGSMRLFRAQRNFYISGFALFLSLVIRRLVLLISDYAQLKAQSEASMRQAESATTAARSLLAAGANPKPNKKDTEDCNEDDNAEALVALKKRTRDLEEELQKQVKDKEALKKQSENLAKEYDRLSEEHNRLEKKLRISGAGETVDVDTDSKKDD